MLISLSYLNTQNPQSPNRARSYITLVYIVEIVRGFNLKFYLKPVIIQAKNGTDLHSEWSMRKPNKTDVKN